MATTFVVEDGSGKSDANAYITEAYFRQYWEDRGNPTSVSSASQADAEEAIRMGTQYLDMVYGDFWKGLKASSTQALDHPRIGIETRDGYLIESDVIAERLKMGCAEMAKRHLEEDDGIYPDLDDPAYVEEETSKVGGAASISTTYMGGKPPRKEYSMVERLIEDLIDMSLTLERA